MKPSLFIVGAPKCGTTAMCSYLAEHPEVCFAIPKEPKYFNTDFGVDRREVLTENAYLRCFQADPEVHRLLAEGTVWYLYSQVAVRNILEYNPDSRFVVMIRNPVDLVQSLHSQLYYGGVENVGDFETAWRLQGARKLRESLPPGTSDGKSLLYGEVAKLGEQIERLFDIVDRGRVLVINHDDFSVNPSHEYGRLLAFAGLSPQPRDGFVRSNENRVLRKSPLTAVLFGIKRLKNALGIKKSFGVWQAFQPLVAAKQKREKMPEHLAEELRNFFRSDVEKLESLLDLDLSGWKQAQP